MFAFSLISARRISKRNASLFDAVQFICGFSLLFLIFNKKKHYELAFLLLSAPLGLLTASAQLLFIIFVCIR